MFFKRLTVGPLGTNCYLAGDKDNLLVIDPGADAGEIIKEIEKSGCTARYIVLTHCHIDHYGAAKEIKEKTKSLVLISEKEKDNYLNDAITLSSYFGSSKGKPAPDMLLKEGEKIVSGEYEFKVIETPGHTSGGICLLCGNILFSGDTLFYESIGRTDFPTGDFDVLLKNVREKIFTLPPETEVYPGHGGKTTVGHEMENNTFF
ncbi:MAG: MBL fold metallo-hydrolase [Ruminococcaceae bacterium]|nr:MBL fold metallo-hydrolase [Oscillospiraceae bacterium]